MIVANLYTIRVGIADRNDKQLIRKQVWERIKHLRDAKMLRGWDFENIHNETVHEIQAQVYCSWRTALEIEDSIDRIWYPRKGYPLLVLYCDATRR